MEWTNYHLRSITLSPSVCKPLAAKSWGLVVLRRRLPSPPSTRFYFSHLSLFLSLCLFPCPPSIPIYSFLLRIYFQPPFPFKTSRKDACGIHKVRLSKVCTCVFSRNGPITRWFHHHIRETGKISDLTEFIEKDRYLYYFDWYIDWYVNIKTEER